MGDHKLSWKTVPASKKDIYLGQEIKLRFVFDNRAGAKRSVKVTGSGPATPPEKTYTIKSYDDYAFTPTQAGDYTFTVDKGSGKTDGVTVDGTSNKVTISVHKKLALEFEEVKQDANTAGPYGLGPVTIKLKRTEGETWYPSSGVSVTLAGKGLKSSVTQVLKSAADLEFTAEFEKPGDQVELKVTPKHTSESETTPTKTVDVKVPELSIKQIDKNASSPDLGDGVYAIGTAKLVIQVTDKKTIAGRAVSKVKISHKGLKKSIEHKLPTDRTGDTFEVDLPFVNATLHPENLTLAVGAKCTLKSSGESKELKVEAPKISLDYTDGQELLFADAASCKLNVKLSYPAPDKGVKGKFSCSAFKGGKSQEFTIPAGKGHPDAHEVTLTGVTDAFGSAQAVSVLQSTGTSLDNDKTTRVNLQLHPEVSLGEDWATPVGPYHVGQEVEIKVAFSGAVPPSNVTVELDSPNGFEVNPHTKDVPAGNDGSYSLGKVKLKAPGTTGETAEVTLSVSAGDVKVGASKTKTITIKATGQPVSFDSESWITPALEKGKHYRAGDKVKLNMALEEEAEAEIKAQLESELFDAPIDFTIPEGNMAVLVDAVLAKPGENKPIKVVLVTGGNALLGNVAEKTLTVRDARKMCFKSTWIKPSEPHFADQEVEVTVVIEKWLHGRWQKAKASKTEVIGHLIAPMGWNGDACCFVEESPNFDVEALHGTKAIALKSTKGSDQITLPLTLKALADLGLDGTKREVTLELKELADSPPVKLSDATFGKVTHTLKLKPYPLIKWPSSPFKKAPLGKDATSKKWQFNQGDVVELHMNLAEAAFRDCKANLTSPAFGKNAGEDVLFEVTWKKGKTKSERVEVTFLEAGDADTHVISLKDCDGVLTKDEDAFKLPVLVKSGLVVSFKEGDDWINPKPPLRKGDKPKVALRLAGDMTPWADDTQKAKVKLTSEVLKSESNTEGVAEFEITKAEWESGEYLAEVTLGTHKKLEQDMRLEVFNEAGARPEIVLGTVKKHRLKVRGKRTLYFGSHYERKAFDPAGPFKPGDLVKIRVHMSDELPEGSDPESVVGELVCTAFHNPKEGVTDRTRFPLTYKKGERKHEFKALIAYDAAPGKVKVKLEAKEGFTVLGTDVEHEIEVKAKPKVFFSTKSPVQTTTGTVIKKAIDRAPVKDGDTWKSRLEYKATLRVKLDHHASYRGLRFAISSALFGAAVDNPGLVVVDDPKLKAPGENLPPRKWGQYYKLDSVADLHDNWKYHGATIDGATDGCVVRFDGHRWITVEHREYLVHFEKADAKWKHIDVTFKKAGAGKVELKGLFCAEANSSDHEIKFEIKSDVVLFPHYASIELDPAETTGTFAKDDVVTGTESTTASSVVAVCGDRLYLEKTEVDFLENEEVTVKVGDVQKAKGKVSAYSRGKSWIEPPVGPYSVGDRVEIRLIRLTEDASAGGVLAKLTSKAFCEKGSDKKYIPREITWKDNELLSEPLGIFLTKMHKKGAKITLEGVEDSTATPAVDYAVAGEKEKKIKVKEARTLEFGKRFLKTKPFKIKLHEEFNVPLLLSTPAPRVLKAKLTGPGLKSGSGYTAEFTKGSSLVTIEGVEYDSRPTDTSTHSDAELHLESRTPWLFQVVMPVQAGTVTELFKKDDRIQGKTSDAYAIVFEDQEDAGAPLFIQDHPVGEFEDGEDIQVHDGTNFVVDGATAKLTTVTPIFTLKDSEDEVIHAVDVQVPVVKIKAIKTPESKKHDGFKAYGHAQEIEFLVTLDSPAMPGTKVKLVCNAFAEEELEFASGSKEATAKVTVLRKYTDENGDEQEVEGKQVAKLVPQGDTCWKHKKEGEKEFFVLDFPVVGFMPEAEDENETDETKLWITPADDLAVGDKAKVKICLTEDPNDTAGKEPVRGHLECSIFQEKVAFEIKAGEGKTKEIPVTIAKGPKRYGRKVAVRGVNLHLKLDSGGLRGPQIKRPIRVHTHRKAHFTRHPITLPPAPASGYQVAAGPPWKLKKDGDPWVFTSKSGEPAVVFHDRKPVYQVVQPGDAAFVPGDKVRFSVALNVPAPGDDAKATVGGPPVKSPQKATFGTQETFKIVEVELANPSKTKQDVTLGSFVNCEEGAKAKHPVLVYLPKVGFRDPWWECTIARPNVVTVIHLELDSPAPYRGCKVEITLKKKAGGTSAWGKDETGADIVVETTITQGLKSAKVPVRFDPELVVDNEAEGDEYDLEVVPKDSDIPSGHPLEGKLKPMRCEANTASNKQTVKIYPALRVRFVEKPVKKTDGSEDGGSWTTTDPKEFGVTEMFEVSGARDMAVLVIEPNTTPDEGTHVVRIRSRAFGPRVYEKTLTSTVEPVEVEVKFINGLKESYAGEFPFPIDLEAPDGFTVEEGKGRLKAKVKLPPVPKTEQKCPLADGDEKAVTALTEEEKQAIREDLEPKPEPCNIAKAVLVEEHGAEASPVWPERGAGAGAGAYEMVSKLSFAKDKAVDKKGQPVNTLVSSGSEVPVLKVLAGRAVDSTVDDGGAKFHTTRVQLKLQQGDSVNYWCSSVFVGDPKAVKKGLPKKRMHPFVTVTKKDGDDWVPLDGLSVDARSILDKGEESTVVTFPVTQRFHWWHEAEAQPGDGKAKRFGKWLSTSPLAGLDSGVKDILSAISFAAFGPKQYKVEIETCGKPKGTDPAGPSRTLRAIVEVYPSDEFCFALAFSSGLSADKGAEGKYYDPATGEFKSANLNAAPKAGETIKGTSSTADKNAKQGVDIETGYGESVGRESALGFHVKPGAFLLGLADDVERGTPAKVGPSSKEAPWELEPGDKLEGEADGHAFSMELLATPAQITNGVDEPFDFSEATAPCNSCDHGRHEHPNAGACSADACTCSGFAAMPCECTHSKAEHDESGACTSSDGCEACGNGFKAKAKDGYTAPTSWAIKVVIDSEEKECELGSSFSDATAVSAADLASALNSGLGVECAEAKGKRVQLSSGKKGQGARIRVAGGPANLVCLFPPMNAAGTGGVADASAVTVAEIADALKLACAGLTVEAEDKKITVRTKSANKNSSLKIKGSVAEAIGLSPLDSEVKGADPEDEPPKEPERGQFGKPSKIYHEVKPDADDSPAWDVNGDNSDSKIDDGMDLYDGNSTVFGKAHADWMEGDNLGKKDDGGNFKINLTRNGQANPAYYEVVNTVAGVIKVVKGVFDSVGKFTDNFNYAIGFGVQCTFKFLDGFFNIYWGYKEHSDRRVFKWWAFQANITLVEFSFALTFGFQAAFLMIKFEAVLYVKIKLAAELNVEFEKDAPNKKIPSWCDNWLAFEAAVEAGVNIVLVHENVFHINAAIKTGLKTEFRIRNLEHDPPGFEYRIFWHGVSAIGVFKIIGVREFKKEIWLIQGSPPDFPLKRGTIPASSGAGIGYGFLLDSIADTWGKAAAQRARILESLGTWQACQLWLVKHASKTAIRKINPETKKPESVSKHLKTEVPPGYQFDPREFDDTGKWTENKKLWDEQWKKCYEAFRLERHTYRKKIRARPVDQRLLHHGERVSKHMGRFMTRVERLDTIMEDLQALRLKVDEAHEKSDKGERPDEKLWEELHRLRDKKFLKWTTGSDLVKHPLDKVQDSLKSLLYWGKHRTEW